jgi:hypothetical protein
VVEGDGELAIGITELNPAFLAPGAPEPFARWQRELEAIDPAYVRLVIEWGDVGSDLATADGGCMRAIPPCHGYAGFRAQVQALARVQREHPGHYVGMVVFTHTPPEHAAAPGGCERARTEPRSRPPRGSAIPAYRALVRATVDEAARAGADVPYWSPWNEPNHPYFISPQRDRCDPGAPSRAVAPYRRLTTAMLGVLDEAPGEQRLVLGETAGLLERRSTSTTVGEIIRGLPRGVVCRAQVYGQHAYVGGRDPVDAVERALRPFRCPRTPEIWITETGARSADRPCRSVHRRLVRWYRDPRVTAAFQYTLREDDRFPTGLVSTDLTRALPALAVWKAWGARPTPTAPPPGSAGCLNR